MRLDRKRPPYGQICLHIFFIISCLCYIVPLLLLVGISFEGKQFANYSIIPNEFTLNAYKLVFKNPGRLMDAFGVTIFSSVVGVVLSLVVMATFAYALSRPNFLGRRVVSFLLFFTLLFSGGMVPSYILNSTYLHLNDTIWIYIIPVLMNSWNVIVIRTYFRSLPQELFESARIGGASELRICFQIAVPLSTPVLASVGFLRFIDAWNNWNTSQIYIRDIKLQSLQYYLKLLLDNAEMSKQMVAETGMSLGSMANVEAMRFSLAVIAALPAMFVFPFFQKYFSKGMVIGSVKG